MMIQITLPDGSIQQVESGITAAQLAAKISQRLGKEALAVKIDGVARDLSTLLTQDWAVELLTFSSEGGAEIYRHSASHLMAQAVKQLFPEAKVAIGPAVDDGFYYDFDIDHPFTPEDLEKIERKMAELVKADAPFVRNEVTKDEAIRFFSERGEQYKVEILRDLPDGDRFSLFH